MLTIMVLLKFVSCSVNVIFPFGGVLFPKKLSRFKSLKKKKKEKSIYQKMIYWFYSC